MASKIRNPLRSHRVDPVLDPAEVFLPKRNRGFLEKRTIPEYARFESGLSFPQAVKFS
jgi:hypothetical protein